MPMIFPLEVKKGGSLEVSRSPRDNAKAEIAFGKKLDLVLGKASDPFRRLPKIRF